MMKTINYFSRMLVVLLLCTGLVLVGCTDGPLGENENTEQGSGDNGGNEGEDGVMTWALDAVTEVSATFSGTLAVSASDLSFSQVTVYYSDIEPFNINGGNTQKTSTASFHSDQKFVITVTGLKPNVKYNYCLVAEVKSEKTYGDVKNFTTASLVAPELNTASYITYNSATITGKVNRPSEIGTGLEYGFQYCASEDFSSNVITKKITDIDSDNKFSLQITGLVPMTTYYYRSYIKMDGVYGYGEIKSFVTSSLVAPELNAASGVTEVSSTISGTVSVALGTASDLEYGFQYCASEDFSSNVITKKITDIDSDNKFSLQITGLVPMTTYYYRSYIKMDGVYGYGEVKSFVTVSLVAPTLNAASDITYESATISGKVNPPSKIGTGLEYGFQYCASEDFSSNVITKKITDIDSDNKFSLQITDLVPMTTYYYRSRIKMSGATVYSELQSFKTLLHPYDAQHALNVVLAEDLSSTASANCYIVSNPGLFKFKTVKGNGSTSVGNVASASILWETLGTSSAPEMFDLIKAFCYKDGYIAFQTADTFKEGNAVIAAKDAEGNILWSWHIWLTDQPQEQVYYNNAGTMMGRNLGAISATPGDVGALGLLYQWGRKDPFLGSSSISSNSVAKSTITWPSAVSSDSNNGTIEYATSNPTTFIIDNKRNYDWYYTGSSSTDNTRWTTSSSAKSIYDPCPSGWRVPDGGSNGVWATALGSSSYFTDSSLYNSTNEGINFTGRFGDAATIWYPASGHRSGVGGGLSSLTGRGYYWSASPNGYNAYCLCFYHNGRVYPWYGSYRADGYSVRCVRESE